jgi:hypothetical protein
MIDKVGVIIQRGSVITPFWQRGVREGLRIAGIIPSSVGSPLPLERGREEKGDDANRAVFEMETLPRRQ